MAEVIAPREDELDAGVQSVRIRRVGRVAIAVLGVGLLVDAALRSHVDGLAGALVFLVLGVGLMASGDLVRPTSYVLVALAPVFGGWLVVRTSPWVLVPTSWPRSLCWRSVLATGGPRYPAV